MHHSISDDDRVTDPEHVDRARRRFGKLRETRHPDVRAVRTELTAVLGSSSVVLLDFDGPVCPVFAGYPAPQITDQLRTLAVHHLGKLTAELAAASGPHDLLAATGRVSERLSRQIEDALQVAEIRAAASAAPTPGAAEFLAACHETNRPVAIVSNNCEASVRVYLDRVGFTEAVQHIEARDPSDPARMKPSPYLVEQAATHLHAARAQCVLIGDQPSDITAARTAGTLSIGYANKPGKHADLSAAGADAITDDMYELAEAAQRS